MEQVPVWSAGKSESGAEGKSNAANAPDPAGYGTPRSGQYRTYNSRGYDEETFYNWAASVSNLLHYTGWGAEAGFGSNDRIFEFSVRLQFRITFP